MQQKDSTYIISYSQGYTDWYVSEFYKFIHTKLEEKYKIKLKYIPIESLAKQHGINDTKTNSGLFNWYNLIIYNSRTEKYFVHSCDDYSIEALHDGLKRQFDIVKFSCVPDTRHSYYEMYKDYIQPSVYRFEFWKDYSKLKEINQPTNKIDSSYFLGLPHGYREMYFKKLSGNSFFILDSKDDSTKRKPKSQYYEEMSKYRYNISLNGAAGICYRDVEIFGLRNFNLREYYTCLTYDPLIKNQHFIEMFDTQFFSEIINPNVNVENKLKDKVSEVVEFCNSKEGEQMLENSYQWFESNCNPDKQFDILDSFLNNFCVLD